MASESWPPNLKDWVAKCLGQITELNRAEVQAELKQVIGEAFAAHTLWTTDWAGVQLKSLMPKPAPVFNSLKRKSLEVPMLNTKKAKKAALKNAASTSTTTTTYGSDFNDQAALNRRAQRFQREHELEKSKHVRNGQASKPSYYESALAASRSGTHTSSTPDEPEGDPNVIDWDRYTIVGTCQEIFKDYLRLTSEPKPETIRPYAVLQKTLEELKERWKKGPKPTYAWICNQFKSLRQDLTVQRIKNEFTVRVYEIHARIALECSDMVEYNQCQATLKTLYDLGLPGSVEEFTAYRILMLLHGRNRSELNLFVGQLTPRQKANKAVQHAFEVQRAQAMGNYVRFCELYNDAPFMGAYIMDHFIDRERIKALIVITKAYHRINLEYLKKTLGFDSLDDARSFLADHQINTFINPNSPDSDKILDCKAAIPDISKVFDEKYRKITIKGAI